MFEEILKRSGRFLTSLSLKYIIMDKYDGIDRKTILNTIANECINLQSLDLGDYKITKIFVQLLQPNFNKVEDFRCATEDLDDEDLKNLFLENKKIKYLKIDADYNRKLSGTFLKALSKETLIYLELYSINIDGLNIIKDFSLLKTLILDEKKVSDDILINVAQSCLELNCVKLISKLFKPFKYYLLFIFQLLAIKFL